MLARHLVHGAQHRLIADAAPAQRQLKFHAFDVGCLNRGHNVTFYHRAGVSWYTCEH